MPVLLTVYARLTLCLNVLRSPPCPLSVVLQLAPMLLCVMYVLLVGLVGLWRALVCAIFCMLLRQGRGQAQRIRKGSGQVGSGGVHQCQGCALRSTWALLGAVVGEARYATLWLSKAL